MSAKSRQEAAELVATVLNRRMPVGWRRSDSVSSIRSLAVGVLRIPAPVVEISAPGKLRGRPGLVVHGRVKLEQRERVMRGPIPATNALRTLLDLGAVERPSIVEEGPKASCSQAASSDSCSGYSRPRTFLARFFSTRSGARTDSLRGPISHIPIKRWPSRQTATHITRAGGPFSETELASARWRRAAGACCLLRGRT